MDSSVPLCPFGPNCVILFDFPDFLGFSRFSQRISRFVLVLFLGLLRLKRTYKEHSPKGPGHNQEISEKSGKPRGLGNLQVSLLPNLGLNFGPNNLM